MFGKKSRVTTFDRWMAAVTFAEAGDPQTALSVIEQTKREKNRKQRRPKVERRPDNRPVLRV